MTGYQKRIQERDEAIKKLARLQKDIWDLQEHAKDGTAIGRSVNPFMEMEGDEEGPRLDENELRTAILAVKVF